MIVLVSIIYIPFGFSQDRKINKALEYIQTQKYEDAEEVIKGLQKKNATYAATYYVQSMLYGSKAFKKYNIDSCYVFYNKAIDALRTLDIKEQTVICTDFKLCLSNAQNTKDSIAGVAFSQYKKYEKIEKMVAFNNLYKGTPFIQLSNELIEELYYDIALNKNTTEGYLDFLNMYPTSTKREDVTKRIHKIEYDLAVFKNERSEYQNYLTKYPTSIFFAEIRNNIERIDYTKTKSSLEILDFEEFMNAYPNSTYAQEILAIYETLYLNYALNKREIYQLNKFKMRYPNNGNLNEINTLICDMAYEGVKEQNTMDAYKEFVKLYPNSKYDKEAKNKIIELFPIVPKLLLNGKYKYINKNTGLSINNIVYDKVNLFEDNQAIVIQYSKYGVIDEKGRTIVPCQYDEVTRCTNKELYLVKINNKMNVFNNEGRQLLKSDSDIQLSEQNNDFIAFNNLGKEYRYGQPSDFVFRIVKKQLIIYQCPYDDIPYFDSSGIAVVSKGKSNDGENPKLGLYGIINKDFQEIIPFKYNYIESVEEHPYLYFFNIGGDNEFSSADLYPISGKWGVINNKGKILIPAIFDKLKLLKLYDKTKPIYFVANRGIDFDKLLPGNCGLIDIMGNEIIPFEYQEILPSVDDLLIVNKSGELYINRDDFRYSFISLGKWGVIDLTNKIKIPIVYDEIDFESKNYIFRTGSKSDGYYNYTDGKYGVLTKSNKSILLQIYDYLHYSNKVIIVSKGGNNFSVENGYSYYIGGKWGAYNEKGQLFLNLNFDDIISTEDTNLLIVNLGKTYFKNDYTNSYIAEVKNEGKFGLSDKQGKLILPIKFDEIIVASELIFAKYNGKYQIYSKKGELILDSKIDAISELDNNFISYRSGEKNGILKPDGSELFPPRFWATKNEYSNDISLEGPYFKIKEAGQYFYATDKGEIFKEY